MNIKPISATYMISLQVTFVLLPIRFVTIQNYFHSAIFYSEIHGLSHVIPDHTPQAVNLSAAIFIEQLLIYVPEKTDPSPVSWLTTKEFLQTLPIANSLDTPISYFQFIS